MPQNNVFQRISTEPDHYFSIYPVAAALVSVLGRKQSNVIVPLHNHGSLLLFWSCERNIELGEGQAGELAEENEKLFFALSSIETSVPRLSRVHTQARNALNMDDYIYSTTQ
jgi:hypothetical protein